MQKITIYSDGACSGNPGPGGWGAILMCHESEARKEINGAEDNTTNNRMELLGVISALELLNQPCEVTIVTDSQYVCNAFNKKWIDSWQAKGWKTAAKKPVKNRDLWERMLAALDKHKFKFEWVKGHNDHPENERCDQLAVEAREQLANGQI